MAYEKKTWETGEVITADGLNHIENGINDMNENINNKIIILEMREDEGDFYPHFTPEEYASAKIAYDNGTLVLLKCSNTTYFPSVFGEGVVSVFYRIFSSGVGNAVYYEEFNISEDGEVITYWTKRIDNL